MVKAMIRLMCIFCTIVLAGCATTYQPVENPRQVWCEQNQPWRLPAVAIAMLDRAELDTLNSHNAKGERWCNWAP